MCEGVCAEKGTGNLGCVGQEQFRWWFFAGDVFNAACHVAVSQKT